MLTVNDLQPGRFYRITEPGNADPQFLGAIVLGVAVRLGYVGVTIATPGCTDAGWLGSCWGSTGLNSADDDGIARFTEIASPFDSARMALHRIMVARDYCAEHERYPAGTVGQDQGFDDWAADLAQAALDTPDTQSEAAILRAALADVLPYAESRGEDLEGYAQSGDEDANYPGAPECTAAIERAGALLTEADHAAADARRQAAFEARRQAG